jgi:hypothetical protein
MRTWNRAGRLVAWLALTLAGGCSASSNGSFPNASDFADASAGFGGGGGNGSGNPAGPSITNPPPFMGGVDAALPPEIKAESDYQSPVSTGQIVWTANPKSGRVAYIDAQSLSVQTVQAGDGPTYLAAVPSDPSAPHDEEAIVINVRSHNATLLTRTASGPPATRTLPATSDANSWAISPKGRWAIAWTNAASIANLVPTQSFQDIAVLNVNPPAGGARPATILAVGYRPSQVAFSQDETRAYVVTQDGISVIDLIGGSQPMVTQNFALSVPIESDASAPEAAVAEASTPDAPNGDGGEAGPTDAAVVDGSAEGASNGPSNNGSGTMPDVSFTTDGAYALVRQAGVASITVVSLRDGTPTRVALPSAPTDLTLAPDGTFAIAVLRDASTVAVLPLPAIASDPGSFTTTKIDGETIGRAVVAEDMTTKQTSVLLFTTVAAVDRLTVLTLQPTPSFRTVTLHAPVFAVFPTADGQNAIVLHEVAPTPGSTVKGAFSIVPIAKSLPAKTVSLTAPPTAVALSPKGDRALVTVSDDMSTFGVELAVMPSLAVTAYSLASPPTAVGVAAAAGTGGTGFVAQSYTDGRITFIDLSGGDAGSTARTITGFELGARVVQGEGGTP